MYKGFEMSFGEAPKQNSETLELQSLASFSEEHLAALDTAINMHPEASGMGWLEACIDIYREDNRDSSELDKVLADLKLRKPGTQDFVSKVDELVQLVK
ncbi:MAG: hypothetical protein RLZZ480_914 [Candidatus Parcubacteria bacterium]|jgi:hypothetical protein